jgi:eukaryotic-like serine/threonine-protein kinase
VATLPTRFGPYEIVGPLGAGGMGEVYRARDPRLGREVALKILPPAAAGDPERQRRFAEEARAAGALNHPNILVVYDVGLESGTPYLVSELVDGRTLRDEMGRGGLPVRRLLDLGAQIADGLAAAHEAGIIHRDMKPENVMVTKDGRAKILDFGLAKIYTPQGASQLGAATQTDTTLIPGTVPYMSPEQARGGSIDVRSDQFSLGLTLYEMATGVHPFWRDTSVQTLSAIIGEEPRSLADQNPRLPAPLRWIIERCLSKDPHDRYAATSDLARDLRTLRDRLPETTSEAVSAAPPRWRLVPVVTLGAALVAGGLITGLALLPDQDDFASYTFRPLANDAGYQGQPAWSPDGKTIAYIAEVDGVPQVFTRSVTSSVGRTQITQSAFEAHDPFWTPDGDRILFYSPFKGKDALWSVRPAGGTPDAPVVENAIRGAISPDGRRLALVREPDAEFFLTNRALWFASSSGTGLQQFTRRPFDKGFADAVLRFSPDGTKLLAYVLQPLQSAHSAFWLIPISSGEPGEPSRVLGSLSPLHIIPFFSWLPDNRHIVVQIAEQHTPGTHLWLADVEQGTHRPLTLTNANEGSPSVDPEGRRIAYTSEATDFDVVLVPLDGSPIRSILNTTRNELDPAWSPSGDQYAYVTDRTGGQEIWLHGTWDRPLVTHADFEARTIVLGAPAFSPDGQRLAYQRYSYPGPNSTGIEHATYQVWISMVAGGTPTPLVPLAADKPAESLDVYQDAPTWSPDGTWISYVSGQSGGTVLVRAKVGGGGLREVLLKDVVPFTRPQWSPDSRWIACETLEGLSLVSPEKKNTRMLSEGGWLVYGWGGDGATLYGLRPTPDDPRRFMLVAVDVATGKTRSLNPDLGQIPLANQPIRGFSRVGTQGFATSIARVRSDIYVLEGFQSPRSRLARLLGW